MLLKRVGRGVGIIGALNIIKIFLVQRKAPRRRLNLDYHPIKEACL